MNIEKLRRRNVAIAAGVRGRIGLEQTKHRLHELEAVAVNIDPALQKTVRELHPRVYTIPEGVNTELFRPSNRKLEKFTLGWVGRDHKRFKNADFCRYHHIPFHTLSVECDKNFKGIRARSHFPVRKSPF